MTAEGIISRVGMGRRRCCGILGFLCALAGAVGAVLAANGGFKVGLAIGGAVALLGALMVLRSRRVLLAGFLLFIPLALDKNFLYQSNAGSTGGLTIGAADIFLLLLALMWLAQLALKRTRVRLDGRLIVPAVAFLAFGLLSLAGTEHLSLGMFELFRLAKALLILIVLPNVIRNERDLKFALVVILGGMALESVLMVVQWKTGSALGLQVLGESERVMEDIYGGFQVVRPAGTLLHPNMLAFYLNLILFTAIALLLGLKASRVTLPVAAVAALGFAALILTLSRGGWASFTAGALLMAVLLLRRMPRRRAMVVGISVVALVLGLCSAFAPGNPVYNRLHRDDYQAAYLRIPLARVALGIIGESPMLGVGLNAYPQVVKGYVINNMPSQLAPDYMLHNMVVHNIYLLIMAEIGLPGLLAFLWLMGAALRLGLREYRREQDWMGLVSLGIVCGLTAFLVAGLFDNSWRVGLSLPYLVFTLMGLLVTVQKLRDEKASAAQAP